MARKMSDQTYNILRSLARIGPEVRPIEIAERLGLSAQQVSNALFYMYKRGLVDRREHLANQPRDKRSVFYSITEKGLSQLR